MAFSINVLLYGPYTDLARRVLDSLRVGLQVEPPGRSVDLRIGLNAVSSETKQYVWEVVGRFPVPCYVYEPPHNVGKYPLMRRMFYDVQCPLADEIMWFDDDSYLDPACGREWWDQAHEWSKKYVVSGRIHLIRQRKQQYLGIMEQPWCKKRDLHARSNFKFVTGGWWIGSSRFIQHWNYPFPELYHNGGDSILGELVRQQSRQLGQFPLAKCHCEACLHNACDGSGKVHVNVGGRHGRRGIGSGFHDEVYVWQAYEAGREIDLSHHDFSCTVHRFQPCTSKSGG